MQNPKRQELMLKRRLGFVGGKEMGVAASLHELSVIVIIFSFCLLSFCPGPEKTQTEMGVFWKWGKKKKFVAFYGLIG